MNTSNLTQGDGHNAMNIEENKGTIHVHTTIYKGIQTLTNTSDKTDKLEQPSSSGTSKTKEEILLDLRETLQQRYRNYTLPKVAWVEHGLDLSLDEYFVDLEMSDSHKQIRMQDIFKAVNEEKPLRILIEGQPGYGKTTLALKLAFDWATDKEYMDFKLVFFVPLRRLGRRNIADAIADIGRQCNITKSDVNELVNTYQNETLFILDGLDEILPETRLEVMTILHKQQYRKVTIVVFSRTGFYKLDTEERTQLFDVPSAKENFSDKQISILGIKDENKIVFLEHFFTEETVAKIVKCVSLQLELFDSPLFLMLLPIMINDDMSQFSTRTSLYKQLFNCIIKHSCNNRAQPIEDSFDLFNSKSKEMHPIQQMMLEFGKISLEKLGKQSFVFASNDLSEEMYKLGFLAKQSQISLLESKIYFETFHLSILEFASACSLWLEWKYSKSGISDTLLEAIVIRHFKSNETGLLLPFLMGLFDDDLDYLLSRLQPLSYIFNSKFNFNIFLECSASSIAKSNLIKHFIPSCIHLGVFNLTFPNYELVYKQLLKCDCIKYIEIKQHSLKLYAEFLTQIPARLVITLETDFLDIIVITKVSFDVYELLRYEIKETIESVVLFASSPNIEFCDLDIAKDNKDSKYMLRNISSTKVLDTVKFSRLQLSLENNFEKNWILKLVKNNQIEFLFFATNKLEINDVILATAKSTYLTSISIEGGEIDLFDLTNGGEKRYKHIWLHNVRLRCRQSLSKKNCCDHLHLSYSDFSIYKNDLNVISEIEPSQFTCDSPALCNALAQKCPSWGGFQTIQKLRFMNYDTPLMLSRWKNLHILHIVYSSSLGETHLAELAQESQITRLVVGDFRECEKLCRNLNDLCINGHESNLKTVDVYNDFANYGRLGISELLKGLVLYNWDQVNISSSYRSNFWKRYEKLSDFCVNYNVYAIGVDEQYFENRFSDSIYVAIHKLCITRKECGCEN